MESESPPLPDTQFKLSEAGYFLAKMAEHYHKPEEFLFNLNAFIQALRNATFMLQSEPEKPDAFDEWYKGKQEEMRNDPLLRNFVVARNILVKRSSLTSRSKASSGLFRGRMLKLAIDHDLPPFMDTEDALERAKKFAIGTFLDEGHSAVGEQIGVKRTWVVEELGDDEVMTLCIQAYDYMRQLMAQALSLFGYQINVEDLEVNLDRVRVLLETDLDPSLADKWGW